MQTSSRQEWSPKNGSEGVASPAEVLTAYLEKSPIVQAVIRDLVTMLKDADLPGAGRSWADTALRDALFRHQPPTRGGPKRVVSAEERKPLPDLRKAHQRMEEEERVFAANLARVLEERNVSQAQLARRVGVGPSAISMMLARRCRPQKRTVEKVAQALGVTLRELWPG